MRKKELPEGIQCFGAVDSHAHVDFGNFAQETDLVLARSFRAGLSRIVLVASGDLPEEIVEVRERAEGDGRLCFAAGVHPHAASKFDLLWPSVEAALDSSACVALGEVGLDFHYNFSSPAQQEEALRKQIVVAIQRQLPLVLHVREAYGPTHSILREYAQSYKGVVHCFSGTASEATSFVDLGFHVSFSGIVTFPRSGEIREAAASVPLDRLLVETDSPYLAPEPYRGFRNEPALIAFTLSALAELRGLSALELAQITRKNAEELFAF